MMNSILAEKKYLDSLSNIERKKYLQKLKLINYQFIMGGISSVITNYYKEMKNRVKIALFAAYAVENDSECICYSA